MIGIIHTDGMPVIGHPLHDNYVTAIRNTFKQPYRRVRGISDLKGLDALFIVDELYGDVTNVWINDSFIKEVNNLKLRTVVFNFEKIENSVWSCNKNLFEKCKQIENLLYFFGDVEDREIHKGMLNKQLLTRETTLTKAKPEKNDRAIFVGQISPDVYTQRRQVLSDISKLNLPIDIHNSERRLTYNEYLTLTSKYRYVLNPLGTGHFLNLRFYETLQLGCIPIQQVTKKIVESYPELSQNVCLTFYSPNDIGNFFERKNFNPFNYYLEDYFNDIKLAQLI